MHALLRLDSSVRIGTGHLMRCLSLAEALRRRQVDVAFVCRALPGDMAALITARAFDLCMLARDDTRVQHDDLLPDWEEDAAGTLGVLSRRPADWLVVDHYGLDERWERKLRPCARKILVVDDLANRPHECDLLLDQNYFVDAETRYAGLIPRASQALLGPRYALLRPEFEAFRAPAKARDGSVKRILIFLGGTDPDNATEKAVVALQRLADSALDFDVVVGGSNPHRQRIETICSNDPRFRYHCQAENMAELMAKADLALGAGGATNWERCFLGLPAIVVATATNQIKTSIDLAAKGVCWFLGRAQDLDEAALHGCVADAIRKPEALKEMSARAMRVTGDDDLLPTRRIVNLMLENERSAVSGMT